jgi:glutamine synthetase type III
MAQYGGSTMSEAFEKLKAALEAQETLTDEKIATLISQHGALTPEELAWLQAELHERERSKQAKISTEQFLEANKILDTANPDSDEYKEAERIVEAYLQGN